MPISSALIGELRGIVKEEFDIEITDSEAEQLGNGLVRYFEWLDQRHSSSKQQPP